jgi:hypothetical protein
MTDEEKFEFIFKSLVYFLRISIRVEKNLELSKNDTAIFFRVVLLSDADFILMMNVCDYVAEKKDFFTKKKIFFLLAKCHLIVQSHFGQEVDSEKIQPLVLLQSYKEDPWKELINNTILKFQKALDYFQDLCPVACQHVREDIRNLYQNIINPKSCSFSAMH